MNKDQVATILGEIAVLLELKGENPFKTRAYSQAVRTLEALPEPLETVVVEERLHTLPGFGPALQEKVATLVTTGRLPYYEELKASVPEGLVAMLDIPGLGPKKVRRLHDELKISNVEQLETACRTGQIAALDGFGEKSQQKILEGIQFRRKFASQHRLAEALAAAEPILENLRAHPDVIRCSTAGSLRRWKETIGDIDFVVSSKVPAEIIEFFVAQPGVATISAKGPTKASVILESGIQADLRVVSDAEYPFALAYFTGSKEHNIVMRQRAIARGLRLNEYGLFRATEETRDPALLVACRTEEEIFAKLDLDFVPPELREDHGEFAAAENHTLPRLVEWTQLRGSLHNHTLWSDGHGTLEAVAEHALELGCSYWAITDHSRASFQANGLDIARLQEQRKAIDTLNARFAAEGTDFRLLAGSEVDILKKGLDYPDEVLAGLDVVVASLHVPSRDAAENTERLVRAAQNPYVHMLGHPSGRLLLEREAYPVDMDAVLDACAETGTWIELNASPYRLDLDWRHWIRARNKGIRCVINCDAHRQEHAGYLRLGAGVARKGWLRAEDIINTRSLPDLRAALAEKRQR